ncbi:unnamed protein product, partial [Arabidopsis halleri]
MVKKKNCVYESEKTLILRFINLRKIPTKSVSLSLSPCLRILQTDSLSRVRVPVSAFVLFITAAVPNLAR